MTTKNNLTWTSSHTGCVYTVTLHGYEPGRSCVAGVSKTAVDGSQVRYTTFVTWRGKAMRGLSWPREDEDEIVSAIQELWAARRDGREPDIERSLTESKAGPDAVQRLTHELTTIDRRIRDCEACLRHPYPGSEREIRSMLASWKASRFLVRSQLRVILPA